MPTFVSDTHRSDHTWPEVSPCVVHPNSALLLVADQFVNYLNAAPKTNNLIHSHHILNHRSISNGKLKGNSHIEIHRKLLHHMSNYKLDHQVCKDKKYSPKRSQHDKEITHSEHKTHPEPHKLEAERGCSYPRLSFDASWAEMHKRNYFTQSYKTKQHWIFIA